MNGAGQKHKLEAFQDLVTAHGARPASWPPEARGWALALLETSPEARRSLADAAELDAALDDLAAAPPPPGLEARILASAPAFAAARPRTQGWHERLLGLLTSSGPALLPGVRPAPAMALAAVLGLAVGWMGSAGPGAESSGPEDLLELALSGDNLAGFEPGELE